MSRSRLENLLGDTKGFPKNKSNGKTRVDAKMHVLGNIPIQQDYPQRIPQIKVRTQAGMSTKDQLRKKQRDITGYWVINSKRDMLSKHRLLGERTTRSGRKNI